MENVIIPSVVTVTGEWIIGGLVSLVAGILGVVSKLILRELSQIRERADRNWREHNERELVRDQQVADRLRTLGHEDRHIRTELQATREAMERHMSRALEAVATQSKLMAHVYSRRGPVSRDPLELLDDDTK